MKLISLLIKILILIVLFIVAISNLQTVPFSYLPQQTIDLPLIVVLFSAFAVGAVFGVFSMFGRLLRLRSENSRLRREVQKSARLNEQDLKAPAPAAEPSTAVAVTNQEVQAK